jgi:hypothetical protein
MTDATNRTALRLFANATDTVVAADLDDAARVLVECYGPSDADVAAGLFDGESAGGDDGGPLAPVADDAEVGINLAMSGDLRVDGCCAGAGYEHVRGCPRGWPVKPAREWAAECGRGLLCSKEV